MEEIGIDETITEENREIAEDIAAFNPEEIIVYSRDWSIETITSQIRQGNIDLNPSFQRRNAWNDIKRSKLIESILIGYPVPEVVLAEDPHKKKSFIVIDGKQRLLTVAGYIDPTIYKYWDKVFLVGLTIRSDLNGISYSMLQNEPQYSGELREFMNSALRCTIITNFTTNDALYDIFYRLNSGSTPLSTQELRQVLNRGPFADFLIDTTNNQNVIHSVMNLEGPDKRLRDVEVFLRLLLFTLYPHEYQGNLKRFLDEKMGLINSTWSNSEHMVKTQSQLIDEAIRSLSIIFGGFEKIGRKMTDGRLEVRFNRVLFEVQVFYQIHVLNIGVIDPQLYQQEFETLSRNSDFKASIEATTKSVESYRTRYSLYGQMIDRLLGIQLGANPF